jgi:hypothetical protein
MVVAFALTAFLQSCAEHEVLPVETGLYSLCDFDFGPEIESGTLDVGESVVTLEYVDADGNPGVVEWKVVDKLER